VSFLGEIVRFAVADDSTVRLWLSYREQAYNLLVDYPRETVAYFMVAFKEAGITPAHPE
jgi:hypothetical protein